MWWQPNGNFGFMVDLTQLPPAEMARHLGRPDGDVGLAVTERLNRVNAKTVFRFLTDGKPGWPLVNMGTR